MLKKAQEYKRFILAYVEFFKANGIRRKDDIQSFIHAQIKEEWGGKVEDWKIDSFSEEASKNICKIMGVRK